MRCLQYLISIKTPDLFQTLMAGALVFVVWYIVHSWMKFRDEQITEQEKRRREQFREEIDAIKSAFSNAETKSDLVSAEKEIDTFKWYWINFKQTDEIDQAVQNELYPAFYERLKDFNGRGKVC